MSQQVLLFFSKLLSQVQKPLLQLVNVYRPVQVNQVEHLQHTAEAHLCLSVLCVSAGVVSPHTAYSDMHTAGSLGYRQCSEVVRA